MRQPTDAELIVASLDDPAAFGEVFERHYEAVRRYAQRRLGADAGEEVAARTFESAFRERHRYVRSFSSARPWLFGIATNLVRKHARDERTRSRAYARIPTERPPDPHDELALRLDAGSWRERLHRAIGSLEPRDRDVLLLVAWADLTYEEVAGALGIPIGTVRSRLNRARRRVRELLSPLEAIDGRTDEA